LTTGRSKSARLPIRGQQSTSDDLDALWGAIHKLRSGTAKVKVEAAVLVRVLTDFGNMVDLFEEKG
jgi:hypothetical protein